METPEPTATDIAELVSFLPRLGAPGFSPIVKWGGGRNEETGLTVFPWPEYADVVEEFFRAASKDCWMDEEYLSRDVNSILAQESGLGSLEIDRIKSVLTFINRGERFCDGHWGAMIEAGHVRRALERLAEIGSASPQAQPAAPEKATEPPPWSEGLQQQTRDAVQKLSISQDGLLHMKHKVLGFAAIFAFDELLLVIRVKDGMKWEYSDVEALLTAGWAID